MNNLHKLGAAIILLVAAAGAPATERAHTVPIVIRSEKVDFPVSTSTFPPGPGSELSGKCLICHSAGMVLKQPLMSADEWRKEIIKMRKVYGAPLQDSDIEPLTMYMTLLNAKTQRLEK